MTQWHFNLSDDGIVQLRARVESDDMIGDAFEEVAPGASFYGVSYDALHKAKAGIVEVSRDGVGALRPVA